MGRDPPSGSSAAAKQAAQLAATSHTTVRMPDNNKGVGGGWRKKIQNKPKDLQPLKLNADDSSSSSRYYFSRKTIHSSRPATPATPTVEETEDVRAEPAESASPRRSSKPKLVRYTSLFTNFKDLQEPSSPEFAEPWNEIKPDPVAFVDPMLIIQSIRSHMARFSTVPLAVEHNSGLFRIFEHYCQLRSKTEAMEVDLRQAREELASDRDLWLQEERRYAEEIRRLELLIAKGTTGVAGVLHARHGSVVDRKCMHRKTMSGSKPAHLTPAGHNVFLNRSTSASEKMAALSQQFSYGENVLRVGTPPTYDTEPTLSRNARSEFDLSKLAHTNALQTLTTSSLPSEFSAAGDPLPDELPPSSPDSLEYPNDRDAFSALQELGTAVARQRGLNIDAFIDGLLALLSGGQQSASSNNYLQNVNEVTPVRILRRFQSQPQMHFEKRSRHFSFEPGEDDLQALREATTPGAADTTSDGPLQLGAFTPTPHSGKVTVSPYGTGSPESQSVSKIPTPIQPFGSLRRETSVSSLGSVLTRPNDARHHSQSSILTAIRGHHSGKLRPESSSRSSSYNNFNGADYSPRMSASHTNQPTPLGGSPAKSLLGAPKATSLTPTSPQLIASEKRENAVPGQGSLGL